MELKNWYLRKLRKHVVAGGNVYNNSRFPDSMIITTSIIVSLNLNLQDKCLEIHTFSGSKYKAAFAEISYEPGDVKTTRAALKFLKTPHGFIDEAVFLAKQQEQEFIKALDKDLLDGDFYIELSAVDICKTYFKYNGDVYKVDRYCHVGTFTDSYLYRIDGVVDFRHFEFDFCGFSTYHMSDTIKRLVVKNTDTIPIHIDEVDYPAGQTTITCVTKENRREGLVSPDCVNGKSIFSSEE